VAVSEPLCDRISRIADQLENSAGDLRGLAGVSRLRATLPEAVVALRNIADRVLDQGVELGDLRTTNEALRQQATEAHEAADSWSQAAMNLYSGREEAEPDEQQPAVLTTDPGRAAIVEAAVRDLGKLADAWLAWFDSDQDGEPPATPERRIEIADHLGRVRIVLNELKRQRRGEQQPAEATGGEQVQDVAAADPYDWDPVYAAATIAELQKQLAAATARAEKVEATVAELRTNRDHCIAREITAKIEARVLRREIAELRDAMGADALQDCRSATLRAEDASGGAFQANICSILPESLSGPQTCCTRHVHDGLMHICALAAGHDTHMCAEGDRWTTDNDTTEVDRG